MRFVIFKIGFLPVTVMDVIDIALMSYIIYRVYNFLKGSRGAQMLVGLVILVFFSVFAPLFQMKGLTWIFSNLRTVWIIAFVILFQPELRRLLINIGQSRIVNFFVKVSGSKVMEEILKASFGLRDRGYGALIVMAMETGLKALIESGVRIQAEVSAPLIVSIFNPRSPLHDGAIIIRNDIIESAKCILPLTDESPSEAEYGTRHRAAIGVTEDTDAVVIVVSEETGKISIARNGNLMYNLTDDELQQILVNIYRSAET